MSDFTWEKPFQCDVCYKKFTRKGNLDQHILIHTGEKPFECEVCNKRFRLKQGLDQHILIHTGEKPFECKVCNKRFRLKQGLDQHILVHTGKKPFECEVCNKRFRLKNTLDIHIRIHTGERPYKCKYCLKQFSQIPSRNYHENTCKRAQQPVEESPSSQECVMINLDSTQPEEHGQHLAFSSDAGNPVQHLSRTTNQKVDQPRQDLTKFNDLVLQAIGRPLTDVESCRLFVKLGPDNKHHFKGPYVCLICAKGASSSTFVKRHIRTHTGEKPFKCNFCGQMFSLQSSLKQHVRIHTGEKPFQCNFCSKKFRQRPSCKRHEIRCKGAKKQTKTQPPPDTKNHWSDTLNSQPKCQNCATEFVYSADLEIHLQICQPETSNQGKDQYKEHSDETYECQICFQSFQQLEELQTHDLEHADSATNLFMDSEDCDQTTASNEMSNKMEALTDAQTPAVLTPNAILNKSEEITIEENLLEVDDEVKNEIDPDPVASILQEFMSC